MKRSIPPQGGLQRPTWHGQAVVEEHFQNLELLVESHGLGEQGNGDQSVQLCSTVPTLCLALCVLATVMEKRGPALLGMEHVYVASLAWMERGEV